VIPAAVVR